jgi:endonuclease/exonuclease/phosphatase family metal-dependent hydrolase
LAHYEAKRDRILDVCNSYPGIGFPDILVVCEITREAAQDLVKRLPSGFGVAIAPAFPHEDEFQVAVFYRTGVGLTPELPLLPTETADVTRETRPMVPVHLTLSGHVIRFVACHWTGFNVASSISARRRLADFLRQNIHDFLHPEVPNPKVARHVVVLGDLNEEPMSDLFESHLEGRRDRRSCRKLHWRDEDVRRVRLYNLAWRYLGEQVPHGVGRPMTGGAAGTWYDDERGWRTFDHVLVSGELLGENPPCLDEENTQIISMPILQDEHGLPRPFEPGSSHGVSDHLPVVGQLILPGTSQ